MDERLAPPSNRKRKLGHTDSASTQRVLPAKKPKTGANLVMRQESSLLNPIPKHATTAKFTTQTTAKKTRPTEQNNKAGPSKRRNVVLSSPESTPTRVSNRISRPTPKKAALRMVSLESDSDFGSGDDPPLGIIKTPKRKKMMKKIPQKEPSFSALITPKVVHLGAIELTDSSDDDLPKRPAKRHKATSKPSFDDDIIDLCSDDQDNYLNDSPSKIPTRAKALVVEIISSDNEDRGLEFLEEVEDEMFGEHNPLLSPPENFVLAQSPGENQTLEEEVSMIDLTTAENPGMEDMNIVDEIQDSVEQVENIEVEIDLEALQDSYNKALDHWNKKLSSLRSRAFASKLSTKKIFRPLRDIIFSDDLPTIELHTPLFFSRAISDAKSTLAAARKREKKRRAQAVRDALSMQTRQNRVQSASVDVSLVLMLSAEDNVDIPLPHDDDDLPPDRQLNFKTTPEIQSPSVCLSPSAETQSSPRYTQNNTSCSSPIAEISTEHLREPFHSISQSTSPTSIANIYQNLSDIIDPFPMTISLHQDMQICSPSPSQSLLDAQMSKLTLPLLTETYDEEDDDDNVSLSGLEFSYPSTGVY